MQKPIEDRIGMILKALSYLLPTLNLSFDLSIDHKDQRIIIRVVYETIDGSRKILSETINIDYVLLSDKTAEEIASEVFERLQHRLTFAI